MKFHELEMFVNLFVKLKGKKMFRFCTTFYMQPSC